MLDKIIIEKSNDENFPFKATVHFKKQFLFGEVEFTLSGWGIDEEMATQSIPLIASLTFREIKRNFPIEDKLYEV